MSWCGLLDTQQLKIFWEKSLVQSEFSSVVVHVNIFTGTYSETANGMLTLLYKNDPLAVTYQIVLSVLIDCISRSLENVFSTSAFQISEVKYVSVISRLVVQDLCKIKKTYIQDIYQERVHDFMLDYPPPCPWPYVHCTNAENH